MSEVLKIEVKCLTAVNTVLVIIRASLNFEFSPLRIFTLEIAAENRNLGINQINVPIPSYGLFPLVCISNCCLHPIIQK